MQRHLIDLDEEAFAAAVAFFSAPTRDASTGDAPTGDHRAIASLKEAKEQRERLEIEHPDLRAEALDEDRTEAAG